MKNSERLYQYAREFQERREALIAAHEETMRNLIRYEGSEGYSADVKEEMKKYKAELSDLQDNYSAHFTDILQLMVRSIERRTLPPPTAEELRALEMLKMRKSVSQDSLDRVASFCSDSPLALAALDDIAAENGLHRKYINLCPEISNETAKKIVEGMSESLRDFLQYDTSRAGRLEEEYHNANYGKSENEKRELPKRKQFASEGDFYKDFARIDGDGLQQLKVAVDNNLTHTINE